MKNWIKVLFILCGIVLLVGCSDESSPPVSPLDQTTMITGENTSVMSTSVAYVPIKLPNGIGRRTIVSKTVLFTKSGGGTMSLSYDYTTDLGKTCQRSATLSLPANAVTQDVKITMSYDTVNACVNFKPNGLAFIVPGSLSFTVSALDLVSNPLKGYYVWNDTYSTVEQLTFTGLSTDLTNGSITLMGGKVPHFSKYGFGR